MKPLVIDGKAPNPGKPEDPKRTADYAARRADLNKLKQIALAVHNYHDAYGYFPRDIAGPDGKPLLSWRVALLPFIEQEALYRQFKLDEPWDSLANQAFSAVAVNVYRLAFQPKGATTTYVQDVRRPGDRVRPGRATDESD